jgi:hypothetical protein
VGEAGGGALGGSCAAAALPGGAVSGTARALFGAAGAAATGSGVPDATIAKAGAAADATELGELGERAVGAAQPVRPAEGGAPPTINTDAANAHG